jgi:hypothetical protein
MNKVLLNAAEALYPGYRLFDNNIPSRPIPFSDLTNAQKLEVINKHVRQIIISAAIKNVEAAAIVASQSDDQTIEP